jgi:hypothetical protein
VLDVQDLEYAHRSPLKVLKNKHRAARQGARRFGKRSLFID